MRGGTESSKLQVTSPHPGAIEKPTQSHLIRTKDTLITQEILMDLGALGWKLGTETKY